MKRGIVSAAAGVRRRPVCLGVLCFILLLMLGIRSGVSDTIPRSFNSTGQKVQVLGQIADQRNTSYGISVTLKNVIISNRDVETQFKKTDQILVYFKQTNPNQSETTSNTTFSMGQWIQVEGEGELPETAVNPGQFNLRFYYQARHICFQIKNAKLQKYSNTKEMYRDLLDDIRNALKESYARILNPEDGAVLSAISLGDKSALPEEKQKLYQEGGIAHILAISSLHITLLGMGCYRLLRRGRRSFWVSAIVSGSFVFSFCLMSGMSVSAQRACFMFLLWLGSQVTGRTNDALTSAAGAAFWILMGSGTYLRDSAFLLSFGCILSLAVLTPALKKLLPGPLGLLLPGMAVGLGTLPIVQYFFYQVSPYGILLNLIVVPLMTVLMVCGLAGSILGVFCVGAGTILAAPCHYLLELFELLCRLERQLPGAVLITGRPERWQIVLYYGLLGIMIGVLRGGKKTAGWEKGAGILFIAMGVLLLGKRYRPELRITCLDVGQGDGILIESGDFTAMIDGGSSTVNEIWKKRLESTLKCYGIRTLDYIFLSHGDQDHINGVEQLLDGYEINSWGQNIGSVTVDHLILPDQTVWDEKLTAIYEKGQQAGIAVQAVSAGAQVQKTEHEKTLHMEILFPYAKQSCGDGNENSMVLLLEYGDFSALFTGDLEGKGEKEFLDRIEPLSVTILKAAHHGSKNGTTDAFLKKVSAENAVISCGRKNRYGHPAKETLQRLKQAGTRIYNTAENGAVTVTSNGKDTKISCFCVQ